MKSMICLTGFLLTWACCGGQPPCLTDLHLKDSLYYLQDTPYSGIYKCFDKRGGLRESGVLDTGIRDSSCFYSRKGDVEQVVWYRGNQPDRQRRFYKSRRSLLVVNYRKDTLHGDWEEYYSDGQIKEKQHYEMGTPSGIWRGWDREGRLLTEVDFSADPIVARYYKYKKGDRVLTIRFFERDARQQIDEQIQVRRHSIYDEEH